MKKNEKNGKKKKEFKYLYVVVWAVFNLESYCLVIAENPSDVAFIFK